jgi:hippurate hydrolase
VTVGRLHAGTRRNIIPDSAEFDATVRTFSQSSLDQVRVEAPELCQRIAQAYGLDVDVEYLDEYPLTINDAAHATFVSDVIGEVLGEEAFVPMVHPEAGAEDFSRVLAAVPGCYMMLGAALEADPANAPSNHSPRATFDDSVLSRGALVQAELAVRALTRDAAPLARRAG